MGLFALAPRFSQGLYTILLQETLACYHYLASVSPVQEHQLLIADSRPNPRIRKLSSFTYF